jgi:hypothetical protein
VETGKEEMTMRILAAIATILLVSVLAAFAQTGGETETKKVKKQYLYEWTDTKGGVHITDDLGDVPERYREKARKIEIPRGKEIGPEQKTQGETESPSGAAAEEREAASKAAWQERLRQWKKRLADARKRYSDLDQQRTEALGQWRGASSGHLEGRVEAERITREMEGVQREIDEARDMVETVIPEEARRAGIPPGWLRE